MVENDEDYAARSSPGEIIQFRCPCCGQHAPISTRLTDGGPFEFAVFRKTLGGKRAFTDEERIARRGRRYGLGSAPGKIDYEPVRMMKKYRDAIANRLAQLLH